APPSYGGPPTPCTDSSSTTQPRTPPPWLLVRDRKGKAGRLKNPARRACPRTTTLRINHSRTRPHEVTPRGHTRDRNDQPTRSRAPVDNRGEPTEAARERFTAWQFRACVLRDRVEGEFESE